MSERAEYLPDPTRSRSARGLAFVQALALAWVFASNTSAATAQDLDEEDSELHIRAESRNTAGLRLFVRGSSGDPWDFACELPCDLRRAPGPWEFAVSPDDGREPLAIERSLVFEADGTLFLSYSSRQAARIFGGMLLGHGLAGLVATGVGYAETMDDAVAYLWILPLVVSLVLTLVSPLLLTASPSASVRWRPGNAEE